MAAIHIDITLKPKEELILPIQYNHILQSAIYKSISQELSRFLHETGYCTDSRSFKLFAFSRLMGPYRLNKDDNKIVFNSPVKLTISSPVKEFCESLVNTLLTNGTMQFLKDEVDIGHILLRKVAVEKENIRIKTLSPITVYSTLLRQDGSKYTCYFQPGDPDFKKLVLNNLVNKYKAFYKKEPDSSKFNISRINKVRQHIMQYKNTVIKAYSGLITVSGPIEFLQMMVDSGVGSKNSQGFGCIDICS